MSLFTRSTELKRFRDGALPKIALVVLLVIPLIYGALYLWAFWAPTDNLDRLPVAIVNLDEPAEKPDGTKLAAGDDVLRELRAGEDLEWQPLDAEAAEAAVADGDVYFSVTIPKAFSSTLAGLQDHPRAAELDVVYNDNNSFLASTLGKQAMVQLRDAVAETATRTAAEQVMVGVEQLSDGTRTAADAAGTLDAGTTAVADGSTKLSAGLGALADGTAQLVAQSPDLIDGTQRLAAGAGSAHEGSEQLAAGLGAARAGSDDLAAGAGALDTGAGELAEKSGELSNGLGALAAGTDRVAGGAAGLADGSEQLAGGVRQLATGADSLAAGAGEASQGAGALASGLQQLQTDGSAALRTGAETLAQGANGVSAGAADLEAGTASLSPALTQIAQLAEANPDMTLAQLDAAAQAQGASLQALADSAVALQQGSASLRDGAAQVSDGAAGLSSGAAELDAALQTAAASASELSGGVTQLDAGAAALSEGLGTLGDSAASLTSGAKQVSAGAGALAEKSVAAHTGSAQLSAGASRIADGASSLAAGSSELATGVSAAADGATVLTEGTGVLADGAGRLASGAGALADGAARLDASAHEASEKSGELAEGAERVSDGSAEFAEQLASGAAEAPDFEAGQGDRIAATMAAPVQLAESTENEVQGFGEGFAPFFIALASFVGALITWLILRPLPRRPFASNVSGLRSVLTGFWPAALIGVGQVVIMMSVLVFAIGMRPAHWIGMAAFMLLVTLAFLALQQMFIALLGTAAGRVVSLVLLMLMLSSSGGTYPVETTPGFFQALHPYMPASYVVDGLRQLIGGGIDARFWVALGVMAAVLVGSLAISAVAAGRQKVWTVKRLHPSLAI